MQRTQRAEEMLQELLLTQHMMGIAVKFGANPEVLFKDQGM